VTHDQKEALSIADRMAILNAGRIEQIGRPQEMYLQPRNKFVAAFMGETNFIDGTVLESDGQRTTIETTLGRIISAAANVPPAKRVTLSIRPEVIHVGPPPSSAVNQYDGMVHDTVYLGEFAQHLVNISANGHPEKHQPLKVFELNPRVVARDDTVERAKVWFDPSDVVLLSE
jgi:ABC-type Fe3+/spermidine/putrescine transport system ATPase subunit